jgi:cytochrome P450
LKTVAVMRTAQDAHTTAHTLTRHNKQTTKSSQRSRTMAAGTASLAALIYVLISCASQSLAFTQLNLPHTALGRSDVFLFATGEDKGATPAKIATCHPKPLSIAAGFRFLRASFRGRTHYYLNSLFEEHGEHFIIWNRFVVLNDAKAIRDVLEVYNLPKTPEVIRGYKSMFYRRGGILSAPWKEWIEQRRLTAPALSEVVIGELAPRFEEATAPLLARLEEAADKGEIVEMDQAFTAITFDVIGLVLLGRTFGMGDRLANKDSNPVPFLEALQVVSAEAIRQMVLPGWLLKVWAPSRKVFQAKAELDDFLNTCINERLNIPASEREDTDMMNILLNAESKGLLSRDDVKGQLLTFVFAGHDTTAHTLAWLLYEVSLNPGLQQELAEEAKQALPTRTDFPLSPSILNRQLPLLDKVWLETNRKHPAGSTGTLRAVGDEPIVVGDGLELPARSSVLLPPYSLHRNPRYWPDPEKFDPSRFDPEMEAKRDSMTFQAFSAGPRNCMGSRLARADALSILAPLLRRFEVKCVEPTVPVSYASLTTKPRDGIRFTFNARRQ